MYELLQKLAVEGWWAWAILLIVVTIAYLARRRVGLAALLRRWEPWDKENAAELLGAGEEIRLMEGPLLVTSSRVMVRKRSRGAAYSQGALKELCNVEYAETWLLPAIVFGIVYIALGGLAFALSGEVTALAVLGALIALAGLIILLTPLLLKPAALLLTFSSGKPIVISGRIEPEKLEKLIRELG